MNIDDYLEDKISLETFLEKMVYNTEEMDYLNSREPKGGNLMTIKEKSLSRVYTHIQEHDTGILTAFRDEKTRKENQDRNKNLLARLQANGYGVTVLEGTYIENYGSSEEVEVGENVFFVVDLKGLGNLRKDLKELGEHFDQDSILFIHKGGEEGILIGTSKRKNSFPGYEKTISLNNPIFGKSGEFMTKVRNRPFILESVNEEIPFPNGFLGKMACKKESEKVVL